MMIDRILMVPAVAGLALLPVPADADERKAAEVECEPAGHRTLTYDCIITLKGRKSGMPIRRCGVHGRRRHAVHAGRPQCPPGARRAA